MAAAGETGAFRSEPGPDPRHQTDDGRRAGGNMNCLMPSAVPTVDILVPCYNYGRYLEAAVRSAFQPGGPTAHVHIIDDASSDETPAVAARLVARYPTVFYTRHTQNA